MASYWKVPELWFPTSSSKPFWNSYTKAIWGPNKCKLRAKETVYWPGLNNELENLVLNCALCLKYSTAKHKLEPSLALGQEIPLYPWTKLATDIFHFEGASYLLVVDYTSCYPVVCKLASMTGQHIASQFKLICSEYGWPDTIVSDNGPCYISDVFTNLMSEYNINHITSSPHYPQSNGLAEKYMQIVKNLFYKAKEEGKDISEFDGVSQYPLVQQLTITHANTYKQVSKIRSAYVQCSQKTERVRLWTIKNQTQKWANAITWPPLEPSGHVSGPQWQEMVSSNNH